MFLVFDSSKLAAQIKASGAKGAFAKKAEQIIKERRARRGVPQSSPTSLGNRGNTLPAGAEPAKKKGGGRKKKGA